MADSNFAAITVAIISLISSITVAVITYIFNKKNNQKMSDNQKELKKLENRLAGEKSEEDARRDYVYEAKKRLYHEYEPLLFQFQELSESAYRRVIGLARNSREGNLNPVNGWLSNSRGYYAVNTIYRFLAPLAIFRLMQRRLTLFDLTLDPSFNNQYVLAKALYHSFSKDFTLANTPPIIKYDPHNKSEEKIKSQPEKYTLQGIFLGFIDNMADALIKEEYDKSDKILRIKSFGEFQQEYFGDKILPPFVRISTLFLNFNPKSHPVLWRILITQACIYNAIESAYKNEGTDSIRRWIDRKQHEEFDWRRPGEREKISQSLVEGHFKAAKKYLENALDASHTLRFQKERFNLKDILSNLVQDYRSQIERKNNNKRNLEILYEPNDDDIFVDADKAGITQVISNLINNSLKFTKSGKISINSEKNDNHAMVSVKDTGIGIDPEIMPNLFSKFATKSFSGTGSGLFISKSIIEAHGGKIWAENNSDGKGATFAFSLPIN